MKKIFLLALCVMLLTSCFGDSEEVRRAKQDLGVIEADPVIDVQDEKVSEKIILDTNTDPRIKVIQVLGDQMLELDELKYQDFKNGYAKISGKTLGTVEKIQVEFSNEDSEFPNDLFVLRKFKTGDKAFEYNANARFKVLDFGLNKYVFTVYYGDEQKSVLELLVLVSENDDEVLEGGKKPETLDSKEKETEVNEIIGSEDDFVFTDLPTGGDYGDVVKLGEEAFTYSDIKGLEIRKEKLESLDCGINEETNNYFVSEFLGKRQNSWYYWNTCRDIVKGKGISFYVIRLAGDEYIYEKHYLDILHGLYGVYELEKGEGVDKDTISEKNKELKEANSEYDNVEKVDSLFRKIID